MMILKGTRYLPVIPSPVGLIPLIGCTMTDEQERNIARSTALNDMPRLGLAPTEENLDTYFSMVREALS